jgi:transcription antitermination factor NusG
MKWLVAKTKARAESKANAHLLMQGYETLLPLCRAVVRDARTRRFVERVSPLFAGYIIVGVNIECGQKWGPILSTRGIIDVILNFEGEAPQWMPQAAITDLSARMGPGRLVPLLDNPLKSFERLAPNALVRVTSGSFEGFSGLYDRVVENRATVLMELLGKRIEIPAIDVEICEHPRPN